MDARIAFQSARGSLTVWSWLLIFPAEAAGDARSLRRVLENVAPPRHSTVTRRHTKIVFPLQYRIAVSGAPSARLRGAARGMGPRPSTLQGTPWAGVEGRKLP